MKIFIYRNKYGKYQQCLRLLICLIVAIISKKIQYFPNHLETARMEYNIGLSLRYIAI